MIDANHLVPLPMPPHSSGIFEKIGGFGSSCGLLGNLETLGKQSTLSTPNKYPYGPRLILGGNQNQTGAPRTLSFVRLARVGAEWTRRSEAVFAWSRLPLWPLSLFCLFGLFLSFR